MIALSFERLVVEHLPTLRRRATRLARTHHDAEDIVQDALLRAWCRQDQIRSAATARGWLLTIVSSTFLDQVRRRRRCRAVFAHAVVDEPSPTTDPPPWSELSLDDVAAAVAALPEDVREVYRMFALERRDYVTIARALDIPKGTVGSRIARARKLLRERLAARS